MRKNSCLLHRIFDVKLCHAAKSLDYYVTCPKMSYLFPLYHSSVSIVHRSILAISISNWTLSRWRPTLNEEHSKEFSELEPRQNTRDLAQTLSVSYSTANEYLKLENWTQLFTVFYKSFSFLYFILTSDEKWVPQKITWFSKNNEKPVPTAKPPLSEVLALCSLRTIEYRRTSTAYVYLRVTCLSKWISSFLNRKSVLFSSIIMWGHNLEIIQDC